MTQQPRGSEVIAHSIVMNVFSEFDPVDHTVFIPLDANTANALEGAIKYELDAKDTSLLALEKENGELRAHIEELFKISDIVKALKSGLQRGTITVDKEAFRIIWAEEIDSLKAELEAARSESKRIVAIAGKELLAAQAQNERLVLAISEASLNLQSDLLGEGRNPAEILEEALKEASPSTPIHEAIEGAIAGFEAGLEEMKLMLKEDGGCDHSVGICWCDYTKKLERAEEALSQLRKAVWR